MLVLDEPTTGLDPVHIREIRQVVAEAAPDGTMVLFASHLLTEVEHICTHAAVMQGGRLVSSGPVQELIGRTHAVAGEAGWGSLRYVLIRPVSRARYLASKLFVAALLSGAAVVLVPLAALAIGTGAFGWHPVVDLQHTTPFGVSAATFPPGDAIGRVVLAAGFVLCAMVSNFAFSLLLSTLTDRPFSAVAGGVGLSLFSRALDNIPGLNALGPWLPVSNGTATLWTGFFTHPAQTAGLPHFLLVQAAYTACFLGSTFWWFSRADILT